MISYITFSSPSGFSIGRGAKGWSNELQYSTDGRNWFIWDGVTVLNSVDNKLYLRGINNTYVRGPLVLTGENISCKGNIESLLDYQAAINNEYLTVSNNCFGRLFDGATALVQAPDLPRLTLGPSFYANMFKGTGLTKAPSLPATTLGNLCYYGMFQNCLSLVESPELMADTLAYSCYLRMFSGCTSLTKVSELPATELAESCYGSMFENCTSLVELPRLSALTMPNMCYQRMFAGCTSIKLSKEKTGTFTKEYRIPFEGTGAMISASVASQMFYGTVFAEEVSLRRPEINTTYYLDESNSIVPPSE